MLYECNETEDKLEIVAKDVFLMDIGSTSYTEFKTNFDVFQYQVNNGLLECYTGLIHSHNQISCFFSGQDVYTLEDNAPDMNRFFSLIVNNAGEYKAAITRKNRVVLEKVNRTITYKSFEDKEYSTEDYYEKTGDSKYIAEYVGIRKEAPVFNKEDIQFLSDQFDEIQERKKREEEERAKKAATFQPYQLSFGWENGSHYGKSYNDKNEDIGFIESTEHESLYNGNLDNFIEHIGNIIVTGILTMPVNSTLNIKQWVKEKMSKCFRTRFGNPKSRLFEGYLETMMYVIETNFDIYCEEEQAQQEIVFKDYDYADDYDIYVFTYTKVYEYISTLGDNEWIDAILETLMDTGYIVPLLEQELDEETTIKNGRTN